MLDDRGYVQLCAEMVYNEVIMESYFNEADEENNSNDENKKEGLGKRIAGLFKTIAGFIKKLWNKVITFITEKFAEISEKLKEKFDKSKEEPKDEEETKQESFVESLMEMVLTESDDDIKGVDINAFSNLITQYVDHTNKLLSKAKDVVFENIDKAQDKIFNDKNARIDRISDHIKDNHVKYSKYYLVQSIDEHFATGSRDWDEEKGYKNAFGVYPEKYNDLIRESTSSGKPKFEKTDITNHAQNLLKEIKKSSKCYQDLEAKCAAEVHKVENKEFDSQLLAKYIHLHLNVLQKIYSKGSSSFVMLYQFLSKAIFDATSYLIKYEKYEKYKSNKYKPSF